MRCEKCIWAEHTKRAWFAWVSCVDCLACAQQRLPVLKDRQTGWMLGLCLGCCAHCLGTLCWQDFLRTGLSSLVSPHSRYQVSFRQCPIWELSRSARGMLQDSLGVGVACLVWQLHGMWK